MDPLYDKKANFVGWLLEDRNVFNKDLKALGWNIRPTSKTKGVFMQ